MWAESVPIQVQLFFFPYLSRHISGTFSLQSSEWQRSTRWWDTNETCPLCPTMRISLDNDADFDSRLCISTRLAGKLHFFCYIVKTNLYIDVTCSVPLLSRISDNLRSPKKSEHTYLQLKHNSSYKGWPSSFWGLWTWRLTESMFCGWFNNLVTLRSRYYHNVRTRFFFYSITSGRSQHACCWGILLIVIEVFGFASGRK